MAAKKDPFKKLFASMPTKVYLSWHDKAFSTKPKTMLKKIKKMYGFEPIPQLYNPISIEWSETGRGFGEYTFWQEDGVIYCHSECDRRETVKRILCHMVDQAIFTDEVREQEIQKKLKAKKAKGDLSQGRKIK